ncbi:hypothetical protein KCTC52924_03450 [Arenibacter antarcticus]
MPKEWVEDLRKSLPVGHKAKIPSHNNENKRNK